MTVPEISVLILCMNKAGYTRRCLASLEASTARPLQIVLIDNGSSDNTPELLDTFAARAPSVGIQVERHRFEKNVGAIAGRNKGMELMTGRYWVFLDNDIVVRSRSWLDGLRRVLEAHPECAAVAPKLVYPTPPHRIQCAGCDVTKGGQVVFTGRGADRLDPAFNTPRECQTLISAAWMLRAAAARRAGPLDDRFSPVQFEDIDYCYRLRELGLTCRYEPSVELYHFENVTTTGTEGINYPYVTVRNGLKFKEKWRHRFSQEPGPDDATWTWAKIPPVRLADVPEQLELI